MQESQQPMYSEAELRALMRKLGLDATNLADRARFFAWTEADAERLRQAANDMEQPLTDYLDGLNGYHHQHGTGEQRKPDAIARMLAQQQKHFKHLWQAERDSEYITSQLKIGMVHHRVKLEPHWYTGAYRMLLEQQLKHLFGESEQTELFSSLLKAAFMDMSLTFEGYHASHLLALEENQQRFSRAICGANDGIWEWDIENNSMHLADRWFEILGYSAEDFPKPMRRNHWLELVHPDDRHLLRQAIRDHISGLTRFIDHEYRIRTAKSGYIWVLTRGMLHVDDDGHRRIAGSQADIHERKTREQQMTYAAFHDPLTGLANRARLDELLQQAVSEQADNPWCETALLFIDLDNFKQVNDNHGHSIGDLLLIEIARRLQQCLRPGDDLARFGGDEFVVVLTSLNSLADAQAVAQRMLDSLQANITVKGIKLQVSASIGITSLPQTDSLQGALESADLALYQAKMAGKAQFALYSDGLRDD